MKGLTQRLTIMGKVKEIDPQNGAVVIECLSGDVFKGFLNAVTDFQVLANLDGLSNDRFPQPENPNPEPKQKLECYLKKDQLIAATGVWQSTDKGERYDVRTIRVVTSCKDRYLFEETHWWLKQTITLADQWLDSLFGDKRNYELDDFAKLYTTNLNLYGLPTDDDTQECAVLSRLIYGFSSAYLLTGQERYRKAAEAGVRFQRDAFRSHSHDGAYCFWAFGRRRNKYGAQLLEPSAAGDDAESIALYEQIYALAGLAQYYRSSLDPEVLQDISLTMDTFNAFFLDDRKDPPFTGADGWFSHIDYATLMPDKNKNPANNLKKNWNSVGDHIPAYLINLILALDPLPVSDNPGLARVLHKARDMLKRATGLIINKFPSANPEIPYVDERFLANWQPDHEYSWQQNRAIIGHNFKIAWNLTRVSNYCQSQAEVNRYKSGHGEDWRELSIKCLKLANQLCKAMTDRGVDKVRGGCYDEVERHPANGLAVDFTYLNTKDFWQQEQTILAYLILHGATKGDVEYLDMARRTEAFWNLFFLDRDHRGVYFRLTENGLPVIDSSYAVRGGHSDASGYHCFELAYLAHVYNRAYVAPTAGTDDSMCLYFRPIPDCGCRSINVLPDFMPPGRLRVEKVTVEGRPREILDPFSYQIEISEDDWGKQIAVVLKAA